MCLRVARRQGDHLAITRLRLSSQPLLLKAQCQVKQGFQVTRQQMDRTPLGLKRFLFFTQFLEKRAQQLPAVTITWIGLRQCTRFVLALFISFLAEEGHECIHVPGVGCALGIALRRRGYPTLKHLSVSLLNLARKARLVHEFALLHLLAQTRS